MNTFIDKNSLPQHIAIIMDGNGRWATKKNLPRSFGHNQGVSVLKEIIKAEASNCLTKNCFNQKNITIIYKFRNMDLKAFII